MTDFTVALIAGGQSSRMGTDKAFVLLDGQPLIRHVLNRAANLGQTQTIIITNRPAAFARFGLPIFTDVLPGKGALGGIYSALHHSQNDYTLALACDMPLISPDLLRYMLALRAEDGEPYDVIVPRVDGHPQGLHAVYRRTCLEPIRNRLDADRLKVIGFYADVRVRALDPPEYACFDPDGSVFHNINTPENLRATEDLLARQRQREE